ncbi:MAG: hypothetical protein H0U04_05185 [Rubrobacter sp.]|nr:hypothetical protein [Rubrobacter sp.]
MRDVAFWVLGTALAFALTATAFLLLANILTTPSERSLTPPGLEGRPGPSLDLDLDAGQLATLDDLSRQRLDLTLRNEGEKTLENIHLTLEVASENTALTETRYYRASVNNLKAGTSKRAAFALDLSPPAGSAGADASEDLESPQTIVEIQATTPEGVSAVRTVILPLQADS